MVHIIRMKDLRRDYIFQDFLYSFEVEIPKGEILTACLQKQTEDPEGIKKSNAGYHSQLQTYNTSDTVLDKLAKVALDNANRICATEGFNTVLSRCDYWININKENEYNIVHSHPKSDMLAVYYANVDERSGSLTLLRNDASLHHNLYANVPHLTRYSLTPIAGRMYFFPAHILHYVDNNKSIDTRVSIAFNLS
jgi:uncharacterized protein (TIGR02466 family)